jgi:hypothetical protein
VTKASPPDSLPCASAAHRGYPVPQPPKGFLIRSIRIEAPNQGTAAVLVQDLVAFAQTDVVPLDDERWEVRVAGSTEDELDAVLQAIARWVAACELERRHVLVDDQPVELPEA